MLKNAALVAKIGVDTAENEPRKGSEKFKTRKDGRPIYRESDSTPSGSLEGSSGSTQSSFSSHTSLGLGALGM